MPRPRDTTMLRADSQKFLIALGDSGMDLRELSEKSGVGYSTICQMRRGIYMKPWKLGKVCKVLDVKIQDVVKMEAEEKHEDV